MNKIFLGLFMIASASRADGLFNDDKPFVADTAAAEAALHRGEKAQAKKDWATAIQEYQASLAADPDYVWADKALANTYFLSGDKWSALTYYDKYLAGNPNDTQTRTFADRLRAELGGGAAAVMAVEAEPTPVTVPGIKVGWNVDLGLGVLLAGADDLNAPLAGSGMKNYGGSLAYGLDVGADYDLPTGVLGAVRVVLGPNRSHTLDGNGSSTKADISNFGLFVAPGYRVPLSENEWVDARLGLGFMMANMTSTSDFGGASVIAKASGSGFALWPEVGYARMLQDNIGGMVSLGYLFSSVGPLTTENGTKTNLTLTTGGFSLRLGVNYYL